MICDEEATVLIICISVCVLFVNFIMFIRRDFLIIYVFLTPHGRRVMSKCWQHPIRM